MLIIAVFLYLVCYCLVISVIYGFFVNSMLINMNISSAEYTQTIELLFKLNLLDRTTIAAILISTLFYILLLYPVGRVFKFLGNSEIVVDIVLSSGQRFTGKYLLNPNVDNCVLVCNSANRFDPNKHLIPRHNIEYISFTTKYYSFDKQKGVLKSPLIILPDEFNDKEKDLLNYYFDKK